MGLLLSAEGCTHLRVAEQTSSPAEASPPEHQTFSLLAPATGNEHEIELFASARSPASAAPVVVLLDGNRVARLLEAAIEAGAELDAVYVTVGYRGAVEHALAERAFDYTPAVDGEDTSIDPLDESRRNGGAADFRELLATTLRREVSLRANVDWSRATLWGHSYGGLFVLDTLIEAPSSYSRFIAVDPSLWWRDALMYRRLLEREVDTSRELVLLEANESLEPQRVIRSAEAVARRQRLRAALPADAFARITERLGAEHRYYPAHHHGSLFDQSLSELLEAR